MMNFILLLMLSRSNMGLEGVKAKSRLSFPPTVSSSSIVEIKAGWEQACLRQEQDQDHMHGDFLDGILKYSSSNNFFNLMINMLTKYIKIYLFLILLVFKLSTGWEKRFLYRSLSSDDR